MTNSCTTWMRLTARWWLVLRVALAVVPVAACSTNSATESARAAEKLLSGRDRPDLIITMSDEQARGVLETAAQADIPIPSGLAVTGWDASGTAPDRRLTTIEQDLRGQGAACARADAQR